MKIDVNLDLVKKAKKGDASAFIQLCENYQIVLYNSAYKLLKNENDVVDCIQETEIQAWQSINQLKKDNTFNTWFFRIMINKAKNILRRRVEEIEIEEKHSQIWFDKNRFEPLSEALNKLSEEHKIPLVLHYYAGFSYKEIAEQLAISPNTVRTRVARGKTKLKYLLEEEYNG
ncbi:hypothetical protein A5819_001541 [Enterococcus sp. 7E2_DIV0204]|uniref:RNA polymerase sigma-70 factor, ECF subfamily n=1 Tax=Candidatus Enterococcus lemimoniae TaxID=1834167 RepID=A0ABZ2T662_9ENTE|nr:MULTISPECIES: RNA polymerase sigma factor [unclassified Enterococcus]OTN89049.1 hypothetical protein A5819_001541 [Enterococcus sp. 7E2_DIV0204]OTO67900.1 hypothetical protein A5866_000095 [Enterococcus sp. 12C11_DIV0727]OTP51504.1 hypothetical protein A5884_000699 [Enterococcus sp. 7D2_DIV0200]